MSKHKIQIKDFRKFQGSPDYSDRADKKAFKKIYYIQQLLIEINI